MSGKPMSRKLQIDRRKFLAASVAALALPPAIARAVTIDAGVRTGTIKDVEHVVILMQENRSFDHYFGTMNGVRGFADRFPIPVADAPGLARATCWTQRNGPARGGPPLIAPFPLNTTTTFSHMRVEGTPHGWADTQAAWDEGRMNRWPEHKTEHSMGYFEKDDIPFQYALANAFTICDAYYCSAQLGTNTNRLFLWTGTNDPLGVAGGPSISNSHDTLPAKGGAKEPYRWTTYVERLQAAGVSWRIYEDMADNFGDNPLVGFQSFRSSLAAEPGSDPRLAALGLSTRHLDGLREDVLAGKLPQVSYVVSPAKDSEHPGPSSPAQGADYISRVLDALTADPKVWARTVLFVNYDENDGFFDHVPPPAPPARGADGAFLGASTVDTAGEYHLVRNPTEATAERAELMGRPYGLGPRVPMYVISPWSRGGWVNSEVFDHTSVIRFMEQRFGVAEPNISPWRRAVCGDLVSAFNFKTPNDSVFMTALPETAPAAAKAAALPGHTKPPTPTSPKAPVQAAGIRPSRALPYDFRVDATTSAAGVKLKFGNDGKAAAVLHVYDRRHLDLAPRRYTVETGKQLEGSWDAGAYDLWVLGPNGFHRHFVGAGGADEPLVTVTRDPSGAALILAVKNPGAKPLQIVATPNAYTKAMAPWTARVSPGGGASHRWRLKDSRGWYDVSVRIGDNGSWLRRLAGRLETGKESVSDPAMAGQAMMQQTA
jgi:phospholipase C